MASNCDKTQRVHASRDEDVDALLRSLHQAESELAATRAALERKSQELVHALAVQREIEAELYQQRDWRDADRRKDEFLATLAHELRSPLATIRNALALMKQAVDRCQQDWEKFYRQAVFFHHRNALAWMNAGQGEDVTLQVDPDFSLSASFASFSS